METQKFLIELTSDYFTFDGSYNGGPLGPGIAAGHYIGEPCEVHGHKGYKAHLGDTGTPERNRLWFFPTNQVVNHGEILRHDGHHSGPIYYTAKGQWLHSGLLPSVGVTTPESGRKTLKEFGVPEFQ